MGDQCQCQDIILADWVQQPSKSPDPEMCRPCMLPLTANWYEDVLENEFARPDLARQLSAVRSKKGATVEETAAFMDSLKQQVSPQIKARLVELDCAMQCAETS